MNNQDYEQKKRECWHLVNNNTRDFGIITLRCFTAIFDCAYALGKEEKESEGEENPQARAWEALTPAMRTYCRNMRRTSHDGNVEDLLDRLFGPKCPPGGNSSNVDEIGKDCSVDSSEPKSAEPFKVGDKVKVYKIGNVFNGAIGEIIDVSNCGSCYVLFPHNQAWFRFCDLEPYTEPDTSHETLVCENHYDNTSQKEVHVSSNRNLSQNIANCDKEFDNILKAGFSKERRLNIAAMAMQGILSNADRMKQYGEIAIRESKNLTQLVARNAMRYAEALIAEAELTEKLKGE